MSELRIVVHPAAVKSAKSANLSQRGYGGGGGRYVSVGAFQ